MCINLVFVIIYIGNYWISLPSVWWNIFIAFLVSSHRGDDSVNLFIFDIRRRSCVMYYFKFRRIVWTTGSSKKMDGTWNGCNL